MDAKAYKNWTLWRTAMCANNKPESELESLFELFIFDAPKSVPSGPKFHFSFEFWVHLYMYLLPVTGLLMKWMMISLYFAMPA